MLTDWQLNPKKYISMTFYLKFKNFHSRKCIWKCCLLSMTSLTWWGRWVPSGCQGPPGRDGSWWDEPPGGWWRTLPLQMAGPYVADSTPGKGTSWHGTYWSIELACGTVFQSWFQILFMIHKGTMAPLCGGIHQQSVGFLNKGWVMSFVLSLNIT